MHPLFVFSLIGYVVGLALAVYFSRAYQTAQPALLYLVPSVVLFCVVGATRTAGGIRAWLSDAPPPVPVLPTTA